MHKIILIYKDVLLYFIIIVVLKVVRDKLIQINLKLGGWIYYL